MDRQANHVWTNWSGDIRFEPASAIAPVDEQELQQIVQQAIARGQTIRAIGARHSCSPIFKTNQVVVTSDNFKGLYDHDHQTGLVTIGAGMTVEEVGERLFEAGLGMENTGHINKQVMAGAISTGTHGAGKKLSNLSGQVTGLRMVTGTGEIKAFNLADDPQTMQALKVSLGSMGIFTQITLRALPRFQLHRRQYCAATEDCIYHLDRLMEENRNFCFYWYPRRDDVSIRLWNNPGEGTKDLPFATLYKEYTGWGKDVLPTHHTLKYNELEYSLDIAAAPLCFAEIRQRIKDKHRRQVAWRILYRPIAGDDAWLSNGYGKDIVAITIHQHATLPYHEYFDDIEKIFQSYGGRPHWGKKHSMKAAGLRSLYPMWDQFRELRQQFDPQGIFLNSYLKDVLVEATDQ
jgi:FAD/FMN-containing dehydrogenase